MLNGTYSALPTNAPVNSPPVAVSPAGPVTTSAVPRVAPVARAAVPSAPVATPRVVPVAREDRPGYDAGAGGPVRDVDAPIAVLTEGDRDDVLRNLQDAESALREIFPEVVLALDGAPGEEVMIREVAQAMGRLSIATRSVEDRVTTGPPDRGPTGHRD